MLACSCGCSCQTAIMWRPEPLSTSYELAWAGGQVCCRWRIRAGRSGGRGEFGEGRAPGVGADNCSPWHAGARGTPPQTTGLAATVPPPLEPAAGLGNALSIGMILPREVADVKN